MVQTELKKFHHAELQLPQEQNSHADALANLASPLVDKKECHILVMHLSKPSIS